MNEASKLKPFFFLEKLKWKESLKRVKREVLGEDRGPHASR